jgi:hypothetical protein
MGVRQSFITIALATLGLSLSPVAAQAIGFSTVTSETELKALMSQPAFVAEGQFGSIALNKDDKTESKVDFVWSNGEQQPFSLSYDGSLVKYTVGDQTLETKSEGFFKNILIYTKAAEASTSVLLQNLVLTDSYTTLSISGIAASSPNNELNIFWIQDIKESFTLTGNAMLSWLNQPQNPANLTYQLQVGNVDSSNTSPDANQGQAERVDSPQPASEPETSTGMDWFPNWFPHPRSGSYCTSP